MYVDSHAHLTSDALFPHLSQILDRAEAAGVEAIVNICTDQVSLDRAFAVKRKSPHLFFTASTTPHDVEAEGESFFPLVAEAARGGKLVAIGETGLDFHYEYSPKELQKKYLSKYFSLSIETQLPIVFHCREAFQDLFEIADREYRGRPALLHCFTGSLEEAKGVLDRGWYLSLSGIVTFAKSESLREVARYVPLDRLLIETDAPYLAPQSRRGKINEPAWIVETAHMVAQAKGIAVEQLAQATCENAYSFFSFSKRLGNV